MAEYRDLPVLLAAAAPDRVALAWIDQPIAVPAYAAPRVRSFSAAEARRLASSTAGAGYGLPFSVMFDPAGRACAVRRSPLHASDFATMRAQCRR